MPFAILFDLHDVDFHYSTLIQRVAESAYMAGIQKKAMPIFHSNGREHEAPTTSRASQSKLGELLRKRHDSPNDEDEDEGAVEKRKRDSSDPAPRKKSRVSRTKNPQVSTSEKHDISNDQEKETGAMEKRKRDSVDPSPNKRSRVSPTKKSPAPASNKTRFSTRNKTQAS